MNVFLIESLLPLIVRIINSIAALYVLYEYSSIVTATCICYAVNWLQLFIFFTWITLTY